MLVRTRDDITRSYLSSTHEKIITLLQNNINFISNKNNRKSVSKFIEDKQAMLVQLQEPTLSMDYLSEYYKLLTEFYHLSDKCNGPLKDAIYGVLSDELSCFDEADWQASPNAVQNIEHSLLVLDNAVLYESKEHYLFCQTWHVTESLDNFPYWRRFVATILAKHSDLENEYYGKIVADLCCEFGIHHQGLVDIDNKERSQFLYGMDMMQHVHQPDKNKLSSVDLKNELGIWTPENITKLFVMYMRNYVSAHGFSLVEVQRKNISLHIIAPLIREFINEVRRDLAKHTFDDSEVNKAQNRFCEAVDGLLLEFAHAREEKKCERVHKINASDEKTTPLLELTSQNVIPIDDANKNILIPERKDGINWHLLACIVGGLTLGAFVTAAVIFSMGTTAPFAFGAFVLTLFHMTATTHITTWLGGSILAALPVLGAIGGLCGDLLLRGLACCGVKTGKQPTQAHSDKGLDSLYINKKLAGHSQQSQMQQPVIDLNHSHVKTIKETAPCDNLQSPKLAKSQLFKSSPPSEVKTANTKQSTLLYTR